MPPVEFEPTISADERPQTYALDRAATGTGNMRSYMDKNVIDKISYRSDIPNGKIPVTRSWLLCLNVEQFL